MNYSHFVIEQHYSPGVLLAGVLLELFFEPAAVFWFLGFTTGVFLSLLAADGFCLFDDFTAESSEMEEALMW